MRVESGLSSVEAARRLKEFGLNELKEKPKATALQMLVEQFKDFVVLLLLLATLVSALLGEWIDAVAIFSIVVLNGAFGFVQEYKAEKAIEALKKIVSQKAVVIRDGKTHRILSSEIVQGDLIVVEQGDNIPADARIVESFDLRVNEAALTGESMPVSKSLRKGESELFTGTIVIGGRAKAIVTATGMSSKMGRIAELMQAVNEEETPLQRELDVVGKQLGSASLAICVLVFFAGMLHAFGFLEMFMASVSLAVAAIPEGLPAVVTVTLALGVQRMVRRKAVVRKLKAVETLGSATVICTDKTGTLTENQMTVRKVFVNGEFVEVSGAGFEPKGSFMKNSEPAPAREELLLMLKSSALCTTASFAETNGKWEVVGDPTEGAILALAGKAGLFKEKLEARFKLVKEVPFDSNRKRMSTVHAEGGRYLVSTKGACESVLGVCTKIMEGGRTRQLTSKDKQKIVNANDGMAKSALRVLAVAFKQAVRKLESEKQIESELVFLGLVGMMDPPRQEVHSALELCRKAGIKVVMITGDHKNTAVAVAKELKLIGSESKEKVITGEELDALDEKGFEKVVGRIRVYARVSPEHKVRIVDALKKNGEVVAMTGDGVNDAPALKRADIGIVMGITGTDVAKEASDMVLLDDNFATIVSAVEEGRTIFDNISKPVRYLVSANIGEIVAIACATFGGLGLPLYPIQLLWVNFLTDGLPALTLGVDPPALNVMERPPRNPKEKILSGRMLAELVLIGVIVGLLTLAVYVYEFELHGHERAATAAFTALVALELVAVFLLRTERFFLLDLFSNKYLLAAVVLSAALQVAIIAFEPLQPIFKTTMLDAGDAMLVLGSCALFAAVYEAKRFALNRLVKKHGVKAR
ncbi:cation-translocating P-type ATPase [Candidatus Micrarchaeota archaeon]|nr:cation-translocating P-type ATPase [Candidatus Micrarchaeota archaeon]